MKNKQALYDHCMETFKDDEKCKSFLEKSEADLKTSEEIRKEQVAKLSKEQLAGLKLRQEIKDTLVSKNNLFVKEYLGEPDEIKHFGDREYWVYTRPVSKYKPDSVPDEEITVIFRRAMVERVNHVKPASHEESSFQFKKLIPRKKTDDDKEAEKAETEKK
ncbi:hypothetical protein [Leptospira sp. 'Mane']|uniref:hypothetical protein n=1 Tax=Leptospira sp. 'Mane' TaxID=3387407 RepID=UPI00398A8B32